MRDYRVPPLDVLEIWRLAKAQRSRLARPNAVRVDPLSLSDVVEIWTVGGPKRFWLEFVADRHLAGDGQTTYEEGQIHIRLPLRIRHQALIGDGDARFAVARELGYATLHSEVLAPRAETHASSIEQFVQFRPTGARSAVWQADAFAAAFLIHDETAWHVDSVEEVSILTGVSLSYVRLYYSQMAWALTRPSLPLSVKNIADEARKIINLGGQ